MQTDEAMRLRQQWGAKPCMHPAIESEFFLATRTGEFNCTVCGETFITRQEWQEACLQGQQKIRSYSELSHRLAFYQHQLQAIEQQLHWKHNREDEEQMKLLQEAQQKVSERLALFFWIAGFEESDGYTALK